MCVRAEGFISLQDSDCEIERENILGLEKML